MIVKFYKKKVDTGAYELNLYDFRTVEIFDASLASDIDSYYTFIGYEASSLEEQSTLSAVESSFRGNIPV